MKCIVIKFLIFFSFLCGVGEAFAQFEIDKRQYFDYGTRFYVNYFTAGRNSGDSVQLFFTFRVAYSLLAFQKFDNKSPDLNRAIYFIDVELVDTIGVIRKRHSFRDTVITGKFDRSKAKEIYHVSFASFWITEGIYDVNIRLLNQNNFLVAKETFPKVKLVNIERRAGFGKVIYCYQLPNSDVYKPYLLGDAIGFTPHRGIIIVPVSWDASLGEESNSFEYFLQKRREKSKVLDWGSFEPIRGRVSAKEGKVFTEKVGDSAVAVRISSMNARDDISSNDNNIKVGYLLIEMDERNLVVGNYELQVNQVGSRDTILQIFSVLWEDMPLSLQNADYAVEIMYHILTEDEHKEMKSGSQQERFTKLLAYWRKNDPSYGTGYNEAMAEYFRRVDYAFFNFQTMTEKDGAKTDRGKVYILNGSPTKVEQNMQKDKMVEIWYYDKLNTQYVFESISGGSFKLKKINPIKK